MNLSTIRGCSHFCTQIKSKVYPQHTSRSLAMDVLAALQENISADSAMRSPLKKQRLEEPLRVKKLSEHAVLPKRGSAGAAGYDLAR